MMWKRCTQYSVTQIQQLLSDNRSVRLYRDGEIMVVTVAELADVALSRVESLQVVQV